MSLKDMIRFYPQPNPPTKPWVRPEFPLPPRDYPARVTDPVLQTGSFGPLAASIGLNFEGNDFDTVCNCAPPDTNGAIGTTQYVQLVNTVFTVYNKSTGSVITGPTATNTLFSGFGGTCETTNNGDGTVAFDKLADRWVFQQFVVSNTPYMDCIAVSQTDDATGAYNRYAFSFGNTDFPDYPKLGVWPDGYYESFNIFLNGASFLGPDACAVDRTNMLTGAAARPIQCFQQSSSLNPLLPSDLDGTTAPPSGEPNFFMTYGSSGVLQLFKYHVDFTTPTNSTFTGPTNISVAAFTPAPSTVAQPSPGEALDTLSDRPMYRLFYRNFGSHESVGFNHSVGNPSGIRWYEIQGPNGTPTVAQQGTFSPDSSNRWMGSTAMDSAGDQAIGFSVVSSSTGLDTTVRIAGRTPTDAAGTMEAEINVVTGTGVQESTASRWGDYSAMQVDPVDDCTFWYTQEYIKTTGSFDWATRIANFKFPNCGVTTPDFYLSANPNSVAITQGNSGTSTITVNDLNGFGGSVTLSASGLPSGVTAGFGTNPTTSTSLLTLTASATAALGTVNVTITGVSGSLTHTVNITLTVNQLINGADISLTPGSLAFGTLVVGQSSKTKTATLTNSGTGTLVISNITVSGDFAQTTSPKPCHSTLAGGTSCQIVLVFTPTQVGPRTGTLSVNDNASNSPQTVSLSGTGKAQVTLTPVSANFPKTTVGTTSAAKVFTLRNNLNTILHNVVISTTGDFSVSTTNCMANLTSNASCTINVVFTPTQTGPRAGTLQVSDSANNSPQISNLTGTGK
jgi:Protein of unknown function (DUF1573)/Abnormal spindle-like microcephaly-assoc'd, ASPM-SPD-2-Hydin